MIKNAIGDFENNDQLSEIVEKNRKRWGNAIPPDERGHQQFYAYAVKKKRKCQYRYARQTL